MTYALVIMAHSLVTSTPTAVTTVPGFTSYASCTDAGAKLQPFKGISFVCVEVK